MEIIYFNEKTSKENLDQISALPKKGFLWINLDTNELQSSLHKIEQLTKVTINPHHLEDCLNPQHPATFDSMQDYDFLIFRNLDFPPDQGKIDTHTVCFILFEKLLLTITNKDETIQEVQKRSFESGRRQPNEIEHLIYLILNSIIDNFLALRVPLAAQLSQWQNRLLNENRRFINWKALLHFKSNIQKLYMLSEDQLDALSKWYENFEEDLTPALNIRLDDLSNHILRVFRATKILENELDSLMELHYAVITKRTNEIMRILTVISAIFLPLTLITNIFGMNFKNITDITHPSAFYITLGTMVFIAITLIIIFRAKKWV